jgi:hypothetical protein
MLNVLRCAKLRDFHQFHFSFFLISINWCVKMKNAKLVAILLVLLMLTPAIIAPIASARGFGGGFGGRGFGGFGGRGFGGFGGRGFGFGGFGGRGLGWGGWGGYGGWGGLGWGGWGNNWWWPQSCGWWNNWCNW